MNDVQELVGVHHGLPQRRQHHYTLGLPPSPGPCPTCALLSLSCMMYRTSFGCIMRRLPPPPRLLPPTRLPSAHPPPYPPPAPPGPCPTCVLLSLSSMMSRKSLGVHHGLPQLQYPPICPRSLASSHAMPYLTCVLFSLSCMMSRNSLGCIMGFPSRTKFSRLIPSACSIHSPSQRMW